VTPRLDLSIGLVADELTSACLEAACRTYAVTPFNYRWVLKYRRPALLFVESAWQGRRNAWKYRIARYPDRPERNNGALARVVDHARNLGIPTVFWNKEDGVHFDRFIDSASLFDHVFTVDASCIDRYRAVLGADASVHTLMFAVQPAIHRFTGFRFKTQRANFLGSYSHHVHTRRREWQHMLFEHATRELGLTVFDRNSERRSDNYRYPSLPDMEVRPAVGHAATAQVYKDFLVSLNVNTVEDSPTMFSRRLIEILACGGIAVTTPARSVDLLFRDFCHVVRSADEARTLFARLRRGPSTEDLARAEAGARHVAQHFSWAARLEQVAGVAL
jgi:spore maturation protein CgeB